VANVFGGGGHKNAAGCTLDGPYPDVRRKVVDELTRVLA
jgi:nanoRNase/pAp phosphatase (c-di-AMP/oligoRNAs hydrolase)